MTPPERRLAAARRAKTSETPAPAASTATAKRRRTPDRDQPSGGERRSGRNQKPSAPRRWPAADYGSTRLVNMRLPVDLHERHKDLLREVERCFPTLRNPSLTDYVIGLLEEAEPTAEQMAAVIRRKRIDQSVRS
jgi:hypothetical protein